MKAYIKTPVFLVINLWFFFVWSTSTKFQIILKYLYFPGGIITGSKGTAECNFEHLTEQLWADMEQKFVAPLYIRGAWWRQILIREVQFAVFLGPSIRWCECSCRSERVNFRTRKKSLKRNGAGMLANVWHKFCTFVCSGEGTFIIILRECRWNDKVSDFLRSRVYEHAAVRIHEEFERKFPSLEALFFLA